MWKSISCFVLEVVKTSVALTFVTVDFWPFASSFYSVGVFMFHFMIQ